MSCARCGPGASGYMLKDSATTNSNSPSKPCSTAKPISVPNISRNVIDSYLHRTGSGKNAALDLLTPRQREVLQLIAEGNSTKEIAANLNLSAKTVETHRAQLMERLNIYDVASLVRFALREGLIQPE
jgi:DNA-binding NarL/FixJ family response regulator